MKQNKQKMKKVIITLLLVVCHTLTYAEGSALLITKNDGSKMGYILSEKPVVTFGATAINIKTADANADVERADIKSITFVPESEVTAIYQLSKDNQVFEYRGGIVNVPGAVIQVYTLDGRMLKSGHSTLSLSDEPSGVYIIKANHQTIKINKK